MTVSGKPASFCLLSTNLKEIVMKVVFLEEVEGTARPGDIKNVADGFARNYLLPRKLAAPATDHYINIAQAKATKEARRQDRMDEEARDRLLPLVDGKSVRIEVRVGSRALFDQ
jgi:large subunit ribosomal protein L9